MILLCRHGQTEWNKEGIQQGSKDSPLTKKGIEQGEKLGKDLNSIFDKNNIIYSSPLGIALKTAKKVKRFFN